MGDNDVIREFFIPDDFHTLYEISSQAFKNDECAELDVSAEELEDLKIVGERLNKLRFLVKVLLKIRPSWADNFRGLIFERDNKPVGISTFRYYPNSDLWFLATIGVLPEYRGQGIAKKIFEAELEYIRARGGKRIIVTIFKQNIPPHKMVFKKGFEIYDSKVIMHWNKSQFTNPKIPKGYYKAPLCGDNLPDHVIFQQKSIPESVRLYEPVVQYSPGSLWLKKTSNNLSKMLFGHYNYDVHIYEKGTDALVGFATVNLTSRKGAAVIFLLIHPEHSKNLAHYLISSMVGECQKKNPENDIGLTLGEWQKYELDVAMELGFKIDKQMDHLHLQVTTNH